MNFIFIFSIYVNVNYTMKFNVYISFSLSTENFLEGAPVIVTSGY